LILAGKNSFETNYSKYILVKEFASYEDDNGNVSYGFYIGLLNLEKYETDPKLFFQILEIDQKIGWTNPDHIGEKVFYNKGIKIIEDQNVCLKNLPFKYVKKY